MKVYKFYKKNDKMMFDSDSLNHFKSLKDGSYICEIKAARKSRSVNQNAYYWGVVIKILSDHTGYEEDEVHARLKYKFLKGYNEKGKVIKIRSTTDLSTVEFEEYMAKLRRWSATFLEVQIPEPHETVYGYS